MTAERRLHPRKTPTEFTFIQLEQEFGGRVLNYSKEGLCFETSSPICSSVLVQFWLSVRRHSHINGVGRIAWLSEKKNIGGIAFVHLSRNSRQRIDEWAAAVPEDEAANAANNSKLEESPEDVVSQIMERVLAERRSSPAGAPPVVTHSDSRNTTEAAAKAREVQIREMAHSATSAMPATATLSADSRTAKPAPVPEPHQPKPAETHTSMGAPALAATPEQYVDSANVGGAATDRARESELAERNSPARSFLDVAPSEGVALAPEQINAVVPVVEHGLQESPVPEWLARPSLPRNTRIEQTEVSRNPHSSPKETKEESLKQYFHAPRSQFMRGAAIGILLLTVVAISVFKLRQTNQPDPLAEGTRNAVSVTSSIAKADTMPAPASSSGATQKSKDATLSRERHSVISPGKFPVTRADLAAPEPSRASAPTAAPTSGQESLDAPTNAIPRPDSFGYRNSPGSTGLQPLFRLSPLDNLQVPTADAETWNGQPKVQVGLGSTPWTFRRRNIHGTPPVGGEARPAELVTSVAPHYPEAAKAQHVSGEVVIDAIVDAQGNVHKPQVVSGPTLFRSAALSAVLALKYKPALVDGKPTESRVTITVKFRAQ
jgi:TonB family protein